MICVSPSSFSLLTIFSSSLILYVKDRSTIPRSSRFGFHSICKALGLNDMSKGGGVFQLKL